MIRVSGLHRRTDEGVLNHLPTDTPARLFTAFTISRPASMNRPQPGMMTLFLLYEKGVTIHTYETLDEKQKRSLRNYFIKEIFPVLTPLAFDKSHPFPFISNLALNLAIIVRERGLDEDLFARIKIPNSLFPRLLKVPVTDDAPSNPERADLIFLEDVISANLDLLFPGMEVRAAYPFRVTRDADIEIEEDEADDLLTAVEESVGRRWVGVPVRIEVSSWMDQIVCGMMGEKLVKYPHMFYRIAGPIGMADLMCMMDLDRPTSRILPCSFSSKSLENEKTILRLSGTAMLCCFIPMTVFNRLSILNLAASHSGCSGYQNDTVPDRNQIPDHQGTS